MVCNITFLPFKGMGFNEEELHKGRERGCLHINAEVITGSLCISSFIHSLFIHLFIRRALGSTYHVSGAGNATHNIISHLRRSSQISVFEIKRTRE